MMNDEEHDNNRYHYHYHYSHYCQSPGHVDNDDVAVHQRSVQSSEETDGRRPTLTEATIPNRNENRGERTAKRPKVHSKAKQRKQILLI